MFKLQITAKNGFFKSFLATYSEVSLIVNSEGRLFDRVTYNLSVNKETQETTIVFKPKGSEKISIQDFKTITDLISESEV
ncbi:hypothetical protein [Chryseobacterium sp. 2R14A]|uniref:hypothetical protein n=1 Tax=Chryseobacterium sp. 2R14A TaxID=3380353 RepID=UPI003CF0B03E